MKNINKIICSIILTLCILCNDKLTVLADTKMSVEIKETPKSFSFHFTHLQHTSFPSEEDEQAAINSMSPKEYTDHLYREAVDFFCSTKIDLNWDNILCVGDSITLGVQTGIEEPYPNNYPEIVGSLFHTNVNNQGIGGSTIWGSGPYAMCKRIVDYDPADAVFILGGTNDWLYGEQCKIGDLDSPITFTYDFNWLCENLKEYYPNAEIFIIIPPDPCEYMGVEPHYDFDELRNIERDLAVSHGFHVIDLPAKHILSGLDPETKDSYYSDYCHLNTMGYETLGKIIAYEAIKEMYN